MESISLGTLIGIIGASSLVLAVIINVLYNKFAVKALYPSGPKEAVTLPIFNWFKVLYYFLPYGLFLFGVIYDGLVRKVKFFPAGFVGLLAVWINYLISYFASGRISTTDKDICGVPGMSGWGSRFAPQNIVFTTTVLSYIASYISASQGDAISIGTAWGGVGLVFLIQVFMFFVVNKCHIAPNMPTNGWIGGSWTTVIGLGFGALLGGLTGYGFSHLQGDDSGIGISSETKQALTKSGPAMAPTSGTAGAGKCSPTDSDDAFVCEAYKNGELVTSTIVE